jgi:hypothetical protein
MTMSLDSSSLSVYTSEKEKKNEEMALARWWWLLQPAVLAICYVTRHPLGMDNRVDQILWKRVGAWGYGPSHKLPLSR